MSDANIEASFVNEIRTLVTTAKQQATVAVNTTLTHLYWQIGQRIHQEVLGGERAEYGKQIVASLGQQLTKEFGRGWSSRNVAYMLQFYDCLLYTSPSPRD